MIIYGVALLAACFLAGQLIGKSFGVALGIDANVGGVGIAMLLLILVSNYSRWSKEANLASTNGIKFWSAMYIPIVVAMAAKQNVAGAITGGPLALVAGSLAVVLSFALVPVMSRIGAGGREGSDLSGSGK
jgi:malonate transporter MadL subunit